MGRNNGRGGRGSGGGSIGLDKINGGRGFGRTSARKSNGGNNNHKSKAYTKQEMKFAPQSFINAKTATFDKVKRQMALEAATFFKEYSSDMADSITLMEVYDITQGATSS